MTPYDRFPYLSLPYAETHPDRVSAVAALFGLRTAPAASCRVLEIGCAAGGNLIPMAETLPGSEFVGIDLSQRQIADGAATVRELGLGNIRLLAMDLRDAGEDLGRFDYVIAHGVYSWVPPDVRDRLLAVCAERMADGGAALVSHNVKPGWLFRKMARDMMLYHVAHLQDPAERVEQARALMEFLAVATREDHWRAVLQHELRAMGGLGNWAVFHDYLADTNEGCLFQEFIDHARAHGLDFLSDADFSTMVRSGYSPEVAGAIDKLATNVVEVEQYHDFVCGRGFRMTLLVQQAAAAGVSRRITPERILGMWVASAAAAEGEVAMPEVRFRAPNGSYATVGDEDTKRALLRLAARWPEGEVMTELAAAVGADRDSLASDLLQLYATGIVELSLWPPRCTATVPERPRATALARKQAAAGDAVTNLRHDPVRLGASRQALLPLLDGTRTREELGPEAQEHLAALARLAMLLA